MKTKRTFNVLIEKDEDGWLVSSVIELPGCHTQGKTLDQLMDRTREAILLYLECTEKETEEEYVGVQQLKIEV
ncbi:type II toxin-antitoxin system HicB family antitoxin [Candidatus Woesearchaeota archaeon]|nr:type II toxin-antitoxin system HicB family antitoxin [Candidatus Woesearchaeota archaeon]HLD10726.1 type II toxin-antitoxin system HicB family antitoxin [Candidatus Nanoarchaeia archaeon]